METLSQKYTRLAATQPGVRRVGWIDSLQQAVQFEVLLSVNVPLSASVLDVGCGTADLLAVLMGQGFTGAYTGIDLIPAFVAEARHRFANRPNTHFIVADSLTIPLPSHDFVIASGLFDYTTPNSADRWRQTIPHLFAAARLALTWNGYLRQPPHRPDMWAVSADQVVTLCRQLSSFWQIRADYAPGHYTAFVYQPAYRLTPALQTLIGHLFLDSALRTHLCTDPYSFAQRYRLTIQQLNFLQPLLS